MTKQYSIASKSSAKVRRVDLSALEAWTTEGARIGRAAVRAAIAEHFAAGRTIYFAKNGKLYSQSGPRAKPRLVGALDKRAAKPKSRRAG